MNLASDVGGPNSSIPDELPTSTSARDHSVKPHCGTWSTQQLIIEREGLLIVDNAEHGHLASFQQYVADQRQDFARSGPNIYMPTPAWLAALDPSPTNLGQLIEAWHCGGGPCGDRRDHVGWNGVSELVGRGDVVLPPRVRAGLIRLLGTIEGVTAQDVTVDGQTYWAIGSDRDSARHELYLDRATAKFVGSGQLQTWRVRDPVACPATGNGATAMPSRSPTACELVRIPPAEQQRVGIQLWQQQLTTP